jgi:hypothetical protein
MKSGVTALGSDFGMNAVVVRTLEVEARVQQDVPFTNCGFRLAYDVSLQVLRGVPWNGNSEFMPEVGRITYNPGDGYRILGFRLVREGA